METGAGANGDSYDFQDLYNGVIIKRLMDGLSDNSFPSGHTIAAFEASVTLLCGNRKLRIPAVTMAFLVAFSRLCLSHRCDRIHRAGAILAVVGYVLAGSFASLSGKTKICIICMKEREILGTDLMGMPVGGLTLETIGSKIKMLIYCS